MIRPAKPTDATTLTRLQSQLRERSPNLLAGALDAADLSPTTALVSTADGSPVGYLLAVPGDDAVYIAELVVDPAHRREGRAKALLSACAARTDAERLTVTVAPENEAAQSLYRSCGFERVRRLPDFFEDGPAVLYRRD
ncbi:MAG: GNAT family N-acetyltransferase [Haloplanus sp.]